MRTSADDASGQDAGPRDSSGPRGVHSHRSAARRPAEEPPASRDAAGQESPRWRRAVTGRTSPGSTGPGDRYSPGAPVFGPDSGSSGPGQAAWTESAWPDQRAGAPAEAEPPRSSRYWPGVADAPQGKGPVRGYAPAPGQPRPLYPPGQFAAWNQRRDGADSGAAPLTGQTGRPGQEDPADHAGPPVAPAGRAAGPAGPLARPAGPPPGSGPRGGRHSQPPRRAAPGGASASQYYAADTADTGPQPGYPVLAVSDPAADVTSTQTWRAVAEGRSTGIWAAPAGLRGPAGPGAAASQATSTVTGPHASPRSGPHSSPQTSPRSGPHTAPRSGPGGRQLAAAGSSGVAGPDASPDTGRKAGHGRSRPGIQRTGKGRQRPLSVRLAMATALVLVLAAAGSLGYFVVAHTLHRNPSPPAQSRSKTSPGASPSASLGPYGDIADRQTDPQPLTLTQLFPMSYTSGGTTVTVTAAGLGTDCTGAVKGANLQANVSPPGCTQVARATYLSATQGLMGTIGVLNLATAASATTAEQSADANDFIGQIPGPSGPTQKIGQGTGIEEAAAKGHYLILIWAQLTSLAQPSAAQTTQLENFMTALLKNTANVSLSKRLLTGAP